MWLLLGLFSVQQAFFAVNQPTRSAILPKLVPTDQLPAANSLNMTVFQAGGIAGPLVGGALIPVLGYSWLYLVDSITLLATACRGGEAAEPAGRVAGRPCRSAVGGRRVPATCAVTRCS